MRALVHHHGNEYLTTEQHAHQYLHGKGAFFVDEADKARATNRSHYPWIPKEYETLPEEERQAILQALVKGEYKLTAPSGKGDILGTVDKYTQMNETYLPKDARALKARVQRLLPAAQPAMKAKSGQQQPQKQAAPPKKEPKKQKAAA
jgi:hypothetical protein